MPSANVRIEDTKVEESKKKTKVLVIVILSIIVAGGSLFLYAKSKNIDLNALKTINLKGLLNLNSTISEATSYEVKYDANVYSKFLAYQGFIVRCTKDQIKYYDNRGVEKANLDIQMAKPIMKNSGEYLVVADLGGKDICVISGKNIKWERKLENNILNVDVSANGYTSVVHEEARCKGAVTLFNPQGMPMFTTGKAEHFVLSANLYPNGRYILINSLDASGVKVNSIIEFTDSLGKLVTAGVPDEDEIYSGVWCIDGESMATVSDDKIAYYDSNRKQKWSKIIDGRVFSSNVLLDKYIVVAVANNQKSFELGTPKSEIKIFNAAGKESYSCKIDDSVTNIKTCGDVIAASTGREVYFLNHKGSITGKYTSKKDIKSLDFLNKEQVLVITNGSFIIAKI